MSNTGIATTRAKPELVVVGKREIISTGQFNVDLVVDKIIRDGKDEWVSVSDIARLAYSRSRKDTNKLVRRYIWRLRRAMLARGHLLLAEGRPVEHVKIFIGGAHETQLATFLLANMRKRSDFSAEYYDKAVSLVTALSNSESAA